VKIAHFARLYRAGLPTASARETQQRFGGGVQQPDTPGVIDCNEPFEMLVRTASSCVPESAPGQTVRIGRANPAWLARLLPAANLHPEVIRLRVFELMTPGLSPQ